MVGLVASHDNVAKGNLFRYAGLMTIPIDSADLGSIPSRAVFFCFLVVSSYIFDKRQKRVTLHMANNNSHLRLRLVLKPLDRA